VVLVRTLARYPALRETFIKWTRHVAKAGKRLDLLSRITSKRAGGGSDDAYFNANPVFEEEKGVATLEKSASERHRAFEVFASDPEMGHFEPNGVMEAFDANRDGLVVLVP
jgi:hypothetical protein